MDTYLTNPKKKGTTKRKGRKASRRNPANPGNPRKRRGSARRSMRRNPGFSFIVPGGLGGLVFRAGLKLVGGDKVRGTDGKITGTGYGIGAGLLYFAEDIAHLIKQNGSDAIAFAGGMAGVAASLAADEHAADLSRQYLYPMAGAPAADKAGVAGMNGIGLGADRPMSRDMYLALAGSGQLSRLGNVVYVQLPDGSIHEVPTVPGSVAGPEATLETVPIPPGATIGDHIRNKRTGQVYQLVSKPGGGIEAVPRGSMAGGREEYLSAA